METQENGRLAGEATYSPEDNKIRLYPLARLSPEDYQKVKAAGFNWAPKQGLFYATFNPGAEDMALALFGEVGDEDKSLTERAEERAERFEGYQENRTKDAERARHAVSSIADNIPLGQPILIGHHSEKRARRDAARIENGMRHAVKMWETAQYWEGRAAGAIRNAKYKERPDVRARRIKGIEADLRKMLKNKKQTEIFLKAWRSENFTREKALAISGFTHISKCFTLAEYPRAPEQSQYEGDMGIWSALDGGIITPEQARDICIPIHERYLKVAARWIAHDENRLAYERAMLAADGGTAADKVKPEKGGACKCWASWRGGWSNIVKVNRVSVSVLDNWGNGGRDFTRVIPFDKLKALMSAAEVSRLKDAGQLKGWEERGFFYDGPEPVKPAQDTPETVKAPPQQAESFQAMKDTLKAGIQVISAPQLFPTPAALAARMVEEAGLKPGDEVLEPSAGTGALIQAIQAAAPEARITAVEINQPLAERLEKVTGLSRERVRCSDFLADTGGAGCFDKVIMNPPFQNGDDIKHIDHALEKLKPGGRLVALCAAGPRQQEAYGDIWEVLPDDTFKSQGTGVRVALVVLDKVA